ncbi:unnamed protein product [Clonostachys rosea]|uniref:Xylanolytic transcriptional activator regulatory domain-containing protein n=1 Tax=Bionectria ochroleuca TaxID=29856 RepID=A0ABY6U3S3_BIOOC|nr:unnamed protein product [Clonostachys rosea]
MPRRRDNWLAETAAYVDYPAHPSDLGAAPDLPPATLSKAMIDGIAPVPQIRGSGPAYFANVHNIYPILDKDKFMLDTEELYSRPPSCRRLGPSILLHLVVEIGAVCDRKSGGTSSQDGQLTSALDNQSQLISERIQRIASVESVQVALLQVLLLLNRGQTSAAWHMCGVAIRTSQTIGLHRKPPPELGLSEKEVQMHSQLLVSCESTERRVQIITELDRDLQQWRNNLPSHLRPEDDFLFDRDTYQFVALLHLEYFNLLRATHWASFNYTRLLRDADIVLEPRVSSGETLCLAAARSFTRCATDSFHSLHADRYMAALAILYRNICHYPRRLSTKTDLALFHTAKEHVERDLFYGDLGASVAPMFKEVFDGMLSCVEQLTSVNTAAP